MIDASRKCARIPQLGLEPEGFAIPLRNLRAQAELYRDVNLPLLEQEKKLGSEYDRIRGGQTVEWEGEEVTLDRLFLELEGPDRERRERAWRLGRIRQLQDRQALNELWIRFLDLRGELARNADLAEYRSYRWQQLLRFDYTPDDCRRFHEAIEAVVVPAGSRVIDRRSFTTSIRSWGATSIRCSPNACWIWTIERARLPGDTTSPWRLPGGRLSS